ncbi:hypothetical protein Tco_0511554 [Tanacetum coccineum]
MSGVVGFNIKEGAGSCGASSADFGGAAEASPLDMNVRWLKFARVHIAGNGVERYSESPILERRETGRRPGTRPREPRIKGCGVRKSKASPNEIGIEDRADNTVVPTAPTRLKWETTSGDD